MYILETMTSMLLWPTVVQSAIAGFKLQTALYEDLSHRPRKALGLGPNVRVNQ